MLSEIRITILDTNGVVLADSEEDPGSMENHRGTNKREEIEVAIKKGIGSSQRYSTTINNDHRSLRTFTMLMYRASYNFFATTRFTSNKH